MAESQVSEQLTSLTKTSLKDWLLEKGIPLEVADAFHDNELDGEMLLELVADHNAADFKEICPVLRYRLKVRSIVKKATDCQVSMEASSGSTIFLPAAKVKEEVKVTPLHQLIKVETRAGDNNSAMKMKKEEADVSPGQYPSKVESKAGISSAIIQLDDDEDEPLPKPFKFPKFPPQLQHGLHAEGPVPVTLFKEAAKHTAHAMYGYCRSVSKQERERVAQELVQKYPKLTSSNPSCPYDQMAQEIRARFKELNRKRPAPGTKQEAKKKKDTAKTPMIKVEPTGDSSEDEESYERHIESLQVEITKKNKDRSAIAALMKTTYAHRRRELEREDKHIANILDRHPFLQDLNEFSAEVERMLGTEKESKFAEMAPSIVKYGMDSVDTASVRMVYEQWNKDLKGYDVILALRYLAAILGNKKVKVDPDDLARKVPDNSSAPEVAETKQHNYPSILYTSRQAYLVVDATVLFAMPPDKAAFMLLGCYYVLHISYPRQFTGVFTFLERLHGIKATLKEIPKTVTALESALMI